MWRFPLPHYNIICNTELCVVFIILDEYNFALIQRINVDLIEINKIMSTIVIHSNPFGLAIPTMCVSVGIFILFIFQILGT